MRKVFAVLLVIGLLAALGGAASAQNGTINPLVMRGAWK